MWIKNTHTHLHASYCLQRSLKVTYCLQNLKVTLNWCGEQNSQLSSFKFGNIKIGTTYFFWVDLEIELPYLKVKHGNIIFCVIWCETSCRIARQPSEGLLLFVTIAFLKSHLVARYTCLLAQLTPLTHSTALPYALCLLAHFIHELAHSLQSLPPRTVKIHESVFKLKRD